MTFASEEDALMFAQANNLKIAEGMYTHEGYEVEFIGWRLDMDRYQKEWEEEQPYWGICARVSNGALMYKADVDAIAKRYNVSKKSIKDVTFNANEAKLMSKKEAERKAYFLTRNGHYLWEPIRLK